MVKRRAETIINRPAGDVWARIGDFGDMSWVRTTEFCEREGDNRRIKRAAWDFDLVQRCVEHDDAGRTYRYDLPEPVDFESLIGPGKIVRLLDGTLTVTPQGDASSLVTWEVDTEDFLVEGVHREYQAALDVLKGDLEG
jgi:hypothetical protein